MTQFSYSQEYAGLSKFYQLNNLTRLSEATASEDATKASGANPLEFKYVG